MKDEFFFNSIVTEMKQLSDYFIQQYKKGYLTEVYSWPGQTSKMENFSKIATGF